MSGTNSFALMVLLGAAVGLMAVMSSRVTAWLKIPSPALVLAGAAIAVSAIPSLQAPGQHVVQDVVTVALACILLEGGMHIGWSRFRTAAVPIVVMGTAATFLTAAATALLAHLAFGLDWYLAVLLATAVAPTDPAMVFSVLGQQEIDGRSGTILEGESGANDPVGIALMGALLAAGSLSTGAAVHVAGEFALQMGVGAAIGVAGGAGTLWFTRQVPLPSEALYPLRTLACALSLYGVATLAHGSGFLAVFTAGIVIGGRAAPFRREIERFHSALASLAEIVAFAILGLTLNLTVITRADVWIPGVITGAALAFVIRPGLGGLCLLPTRLRAGERAFVLFAGLKGAVPILLGSFLLTAHIAGASRLYGIVAIVVIFSVVVQGSLVPAAAHLFRVRLRLVEPEPWALGVRLQDEPSGVHHLTVAPGSPADGHVVSGVPGLPADVWISFIVRDGLLLALSDSTRLQAGDNVLVLADAQLHTDLSAAFEQPAQADRP